MNDEPMEVERAKAFAAFTYRMSAMIDVGICLGRIVQVLAKDAPAPYDEFCRPISDRWLQKENEFLPFSAIMAERPDLFPEFYINTVQCGEIGGCLEISFADLTELLEDTLRLWSARGRPAEWITLLLSPDAREQGEWRELDAGRRRLVLYLFCKSLGMMLASGVPVIQACRTAAAFLPRKEREHFTNGLEDALQSGGRLSAFLGEVGFAPPFLLQMVSIGEESGSLDPVLVKAALVYHRELEIDST